MISINENLSIYSSYLIEKMIGEGKGLNFTVLTNEVLSLLRKSLKKDRGRFFDGMDSYYIPNSYIQIHVKKNFDPIDELKVIQIRPQRDNLGLNIFVNNNEDKKMLTHSLKINPDEDVVDNMRDDLTNQILIETMYYESDIEIAISLI